MAESAYVTLMKFPTQSTNIFPMANSKLGGQLATEFNLKSRESVATNSLVKYTIGQSFVHSEDDFQVNAVAGSDTRLEISSGRGVIDGHYLELLTPIEIDMTEVNAGRTNPLSGDLAIGLKVIYSTEATMEGTIKVEGPLDSNNSDDAVYQGIQVVIGPATGSSKLLVPAETPTNRSKVTAHIILATFNYNAGNGYINPDSIYNNVDKIKSIDASRLFNLDDTLGNDYVKTPTMGDVSGLYGFAGKPKSLTDPTPTFDLERMDNCLFEWRNMNIDLVEEGLVDEDPAAYDRSRGKAGAKFIADSTGLYMDVPAKQGYILVNGRRKYRTNLKVPLPEADYVSNSYGVVGPAYTKNVKEINNRLNGFFHLINGKQREYIDILIDREDLPKITGKFNVGDYIVVREDQTPTDVVSFEGTGYPSTMYPIIPGIVKSAMYLGHEKIMNSINMSDFIDGVCIGTIVSDYKHAPFVIGEDNKPKKFDGEFDSEGHPIYDEDADITESYISTFLGLETSKFRGETKIDPDYESSQQISAAQEAAAAAMLVMMFKWSSYMSARMNYINNPSEANKQAMEDALRSYEDAKVSYQIAQISYFTVFGVKDYFIYRIENEPNPEDPENPNHTDYVFAVKSADPVEYGGPIWLSGPTYPATEDSIGGFKDVDSSILGRGYVHLDGEGHLVINDFALLMGDILALQLAQGFSIPSGLSVEAIQKELDDYGNNRVAFPNYEVLNQIIASAELTEDLGIPSYRIEIHLSLPLVEEGQTATINLHNIDSRFGTYIHLYIEGNAESNTILNISDCQKIRIDSNISGTPTINLNNSRLYYDASVINRINNIYGLSLWYERFTDQDPRIHIDGMTVCSDVKVRADSDVNVGRKYDSETGEVDVNDLYYGYNIESVTFSSYGEMIGAGINIVNATTANALEFQPSTEGFLYKEFILPQNPTDLQYPINKVKNVIKIDGAFTTVYRIATSDKHVCIDTIFSATINTVNQAAEVAAGRIGIHYTGKLVNYSGEDNLVYTQLSDDDILIHGNSDLTTLNGAAGTRSYHTFRGISGNNISD